MTTQQSVDQAKTEAFLGKVLTDTSGMTMTIMASIGDRLGLFKQLAHGPATSAQLATRADINERYAREWLGAMASAGYVEYDPASERFTLPAEHLPVLAQENGPIFFGGIHQMLAGMVGPLNQLIQAFQHGGGVPQSAYDHNMWDGLERYTAGWFENLLIDRKSTRLNSSHRTISYAVFCLKKKKCTIAAAVLAIGLAIGVVGVTFGY